MVDSIKLVFLHETQQVREFQSDYSPVSEQAFHSGNETVEIRHLREHIVAEEQIRTFSFRRQFSSHLPVEKPDERRDVSLERSRGDISRRFNAENRNPASDEILE